MLGKSVDERKGEATGGLPQPIRLLQPYLGGLFRQPPPSHAGLVVPTRVVAQLLPKQYAWRS